MEWLTNVCEPAKTVGCNPCDPSRMGSVAASADDSEAGGGIWPSSQKRSAAYYVRRGFESQAGKAASHKAAPKKWHHDFTSFVRKDIVLKVENEFHTQGLSTMLLCNKRLDEAGQLVVIESQTVTDNVWKIVDVNECFCKSMHVTRSQIRFMDWLKLCGKATESKSLLKIVQIMSKGTGTPAVSIILYGGRHLDRPFLVEVSFDPVLDTMSHASNYLVRFRQCMVPDAALLQHIKYKNEFKSTDLQASSMKSELVASSDALQAMKLEREHKIRAEHLQTQLEQQKLANVGITVKRHVNQIKFEQQDLNPLSPRSPRKGRFDGIPKLKK